MIRAQIASISTACSGEKNSNLGGAADFAACRAWVAAESIAGHCADTQAADIPAKPCERISRRVKVLFINSSAEGERSECML
jgi:hypothetical protein